MRLWLALCGVLLVAGCAGPHSSGALWSARNLELEAQLFKLSDTQRADQARAFEQSVADELLAGERARLEAELSTCPGPLQQVGASRGDKVRDTIRLQAQGDAARVDGVAQLALADWRLRRAAATGHQDFCGLARVALSGERSSATAEMLATLTVATVTRDPRQGVTTSCESALVCLSDYALGYVDAVQAPAPLPQYLGLVYGGFLVAPGQPPVTDSEAAASMVDAQAAAYPEWEPDALYAMLHGTTK